MGVGGGGFTVLRSASVTALVVLTTLALLAQPVLADNGALIREVEMLRNSLPPADRSRPELTLRLADLFSDEVVVLGRKLEPTEADLAKLEQSRRRAVALYEEAISGASGTFAAPVGTLKLKIQFQMAKLFSDMPGQSAKALTLWKTLLEQESIAEFRREAALRLAESHDGPQADQYFQKAVELCAGTDLCSYAHFKRAWLLRNLNRLPEAVEEMKLALYDSKGQLREESLRDLVSFWALMPGDGKGNLSSADQLAAKHSRPTILNELAEAYFASGNRVAGTTVLEFVNTRTPELKHQIRLLEEYYGLRNWDRFHEVLEQAKAAPAQSLEADSQVEAEKILRRLAIQLDGERNTQAQHVADFKAVSLLYLSLFPTHKERMKMIEGWLAAEKDDASESNQVKTWLSSSVFAFSAEEETKLREFRAAAAQKLKDWPVLIEEMGALASKSGRRDHRYHVARAQYEVKNYDAALAGFVELSKPESWPKGVADEWAVQSQNLALDILGQRKDFDGISAQVATWAAPAVRSKFAKDAKLSKELEEMEQISMQAQFEKAAVAGASPIALATFKEFCLAGKVADKSCENARVLAIQLKDQDTLLAVLQKQNKESDLAAEYEAAGYFAQAAKLIEKLQKSGSDDIAQLRLGLLYELGDEIAERNRVLRAAQARLSKSKSMGQSEILFYASFKDAGMLTADALAFPWSVETRQRLAEQLEAQGKGSAKTRDIVLKASAATGPAWTRYVLAEIAQLDGAQAKISFYGRNGQAKFEQRLKALKKLVASADGYLQKADLGTRVKLASALTRSHQRLADEITGTPLPEGIDEAAITEVKGSLEKLAEPFVEKAKAYDAIAQEQLAKVEDPAQRASLEAWLKGEEQPVQTAAAAPTRELSVDRAAVKAALAVLAKDPSSREALSALKAQYENAGQARLAAYFEGRLRSLGGTSQ